MKCSYAGPEGRACASHFDVVNPLDKQVVASMGDESIPVCFRGRSVCPNIAAPRTIETSVAPKHVMYGIEALWMYKHAWRGAGLYYRKGDHQVPKSETADKPPSMYKALGMCPVWDKWLMPRCEPIAERFYNDPKRWSLSEYDDDDPFGDTPLLGYVGFGYQILEKLKFEEGSLFQLWYGLLRPNEKVFWHTFMRKAQQKIEYRWDDFLADKQAGKISEDEPYEPPVTNFDPRFRYYDNYIDIVGHLPETSTRAEEEAKSSMWELDELELELSMAMDPESFASRVVDRTLISVSIETGRTPIQAGENLRLVRRQSSQQWEEPSQGRWTAPIAQESWAGCTFKVTCATSSASSTTATWFRFLRESTYRMARYGNTLDIA